MGSRAATGFEGQMLILPAHLQSQRWAYGRLAHSLLSVGAIHAGFFGFGAGLAFLA